MNKSFGSENVINDFFADPEISKRLHKEIQQYTLPVDGVDTEHLTIRISPKPEYTDTRTSVIFRKDVSNPGKLTPQQIDDAYTELLKRIFLLSFGLKDPSRTIITPKIDS